MADHSDDTRARLLNAAAEVFAEHGYENATIREICRRANANVALVSYYFGEKLHLYTEVLRCSATPPATPPVSPSTSPEEALRQMIYAMVDRMLDPEAQKNLRYRLMMHECVQPTTATERVVDEVLRPVYQRMCELAGAVLHLPADHEKTRLSVHSIFGQIAHWAHSRPVLPRLWPQMRMTLEQRQQIAQHIADFSLAYLRSYRLKSVSPRLPLSGRDRKAMVLKGDDDRSRMVAHPETKDLPWEKP